MSKKLKAELVAYNGRGVAGGDGGRLRWRVRSTANGKKISASSEGYVKDRDRRKSVELTMAACERWLRENP